MSAHTELVHRFYEAWSDGDVDGMLATLHADIELHPVLGVLYEQDGFHGHEEMRQHVVQLHEKWDSFEAIVESLHEDGDMVYAFVRLLGRRGGRTADARIGVEVRFRGGLIVSFLGRDIWELAEQLGVEV